MSILPKKYDDEPRGLAGFQSEMNRLFDRFLGGDLPSLFRGAGFAPAVDVIETAESVQVKAEMPGLKAEDFDLSVTGDVLTIRGEKKEEREEKGKNFHRVERSWGSFSRAVPLPAYADTEKVSAEYRDGVLHVTFAKKGETQGKTIKVDVG